MLWRSLQQIHVNSPQSSAVACQMISQERTLTLYPDRAQAQLWQDIG